MRVTLKIVGQNLLTMGQFGILYQCENISDGFKYTNFYHINIELSEFGIQLLHRFDGYMFSFLLNYYWWFGIAKATWKIRSSFWMNLIYAHIICTTYTYTFSYDQATYSDSSSSGKSVRLSNSLTTGHIFTFPRSQLIYCPYKRHFPRLWIPMTRVLWTPFHLLCCWLNQQSNSLIWVMMNIGMMNC